MAKYRGADGWIYDDSVSGPRRYENKDVVEPEKQKKEDPPVKKLNQCPNCRLTACWRREEGYCNNCGWGKEEGGIEPPTPPQKKKKQKSADAFCCFLLGVFIVCPLVGAGMGYGFGGFGGLLVGVGLGVGIPFGLCALIAAGSTKKGSK